jgi:GNAT superfamily N-acetyltransferase
MKILVEPVGPETQAAAAHIRNQVFEREWNCGVEEVGACSAEGALHLIARCEKTGNPVGTLSVVETTGDVSVHANFHLYFRNRARVARYTQLAVLPTHRGLNIPYLLMLEARRRYVIPQRFHHTWLLLPAARARSSRFPELFGFQMNSRVFDTVLGRVCVLVREEQVGATGIAEISPFVSNGFCAERCAGLNAINSIPCGSLQSLSR